MLPRQRLSVGVATTAKHALNNRTASLFANGFGEYVEKGVGEIFNTLTVFEMFIEFGKGLFIPLNVNPGTH